MSRAADGAGAEHAGAAGDGAPVRRGVEHSADRPVSGAARVDGAGVDYRVSAGVTAPSRRSALT